MDVTEFTLDCFSLSGRNAIVTGGNTGLGQAFSVALATAGANVFVPTLVDDGGTTAALVGGDGGEYASMQADLTAARVPAAVISACIERFGSVDILVNSAGVCPMGEVLDFDRTPWDATIAVNLTAAFEMTHEAAKVMVSQRSGKVINICSMFSFLGGRMSPAYSASKHGIAGLTRAYCDELAAYGIQVNGIAPGYYATAITERTRSDPVTNQRVLDHIPAGRWGDGADLMGTVVFLASRASDYVNGHVLAVDGGYLVR